MRRFSTLLSRLFFCALLPAGVSYAYAQEYALPNAASTILRLELAAPVKVKWGAPVAARTVETLYRSDQVSIPAGTVVTGRVVSVTPAARNKRISAMSHGDFTPLHEVAIQFDTLRFAEGSSVPISVSLAEQSSEIVHFRSSPAKRLSLMSRLRATFNDQKKQAISTVTAPGKLDRIEQYVYSQLPWHPERINAGSQYDVTLLRPIQMVPGNASRTDKSGTKKEDDALRESATLHARLEDELSSKTAKQDDAVVAVVTAPLLDPTGQIEIPQGSLLRGRVLRSHPARNWGRNGGLRFTFNRVDFPQGTQQQVAGVPASVDGSKDGSLRLDAEGGVEPDSNKGFMAPFALGMLATSAFLDDEGALGHTAAASNGFGLITRLVAILTGSKWVGGAIGIAATGRTVYTRFIGHGRDVVFRRNSRVEIEVGPIHKSLVTSVQP
ncbi:MAG: hypothetical protein M3O09_02145 [Acidobacteriota bacterium]|nr:hypothetical protein [Acidobacteriota bacterium]